MKTVTVSLPVEIAQWARIWAAEHDTSVSNMLRCLLEEKMEREQTYPKAMSSFLSRKPKKLKTSGSYPSRESLHER